MKPTLTYVALSALAMALLATGASHAKFPPPSDEAKAKAAETAAKTAHTGKVADYQLCKSTDKVAADYRAAAKKAGKAASAPVTTPPCADPGPFVYTPAPPASGAAVTAAAAPAAAAAPGAKPAAPAAAPAPVKK